MPARHYRAHQRFMVNLPLTVTSIHRSVSTRGQTIDLGVGGAACELETPMRLGEQVQVTIGVEPSRVLRGDIAWVGWAEGSAVRVGVRFATDDIEALASLLDTLAFPEAEVGT